MNEEKVQHIYHLLSIMHLVKDDPGLGWVADAARKALQELHPDQQAASDALAEEQESSTLNRRI